MNKLNTLFEKIDNAKELDFGTIFNDSIALFKKTWVQGLLLQLLSLLIMLPVIIIFFIPFIKLEITQLQRAYFDPELYNVFFESMSLLYIIFLIISTTILSTLSVALYIAFFKIMKKIDDQEQVVLKDFFYFFKSQYLGKILALILVIVITVIFSASLCYIPILYVIIPLSFMGIIYAFNEDLSVLDIVKVSFKLGNKKWLLTFGLLVVIYLCISLITILTCGIGSLFLNVLIYHPIYLVYKHVVGFNVKLDTADALIE